MLLIISFYKLGLAGSKSRPYGIAGGSGSDFNKDTKVTKWIRALLLSRLALRIFHRPEYLFALGGAISGPYIILWQGHKANKQAFVLRAQNGSFNKQGDFDPEINVGKFPNEKEYQESQAYAV